MKHCNCCRTTYTPKTWATLPYVGRMDELELRNCACGSTLAIVTARSIESRPPCELYAGPLTERGVM